MSNPLIKYKSYHQNHTNVLIHQVGVPLLLATAYATMPIAVSLPLNLLYSVTYLLFDVMSTKSIQSVGYVQAIYLLHFVFRYLSVYENAAIHALCWIAQIIGHRVFEGNSPAFLENLTESFLFAPYLTFLETFYPSAFDLKPPYSIVKMDGYDASKKSVLYFAGLFQKASVEYATIAKDLSQFNHVFIDIQCKNGQILKKLVGEIINELKDIQIECIVGFSLGGSLALQYKELYRQLTGEDVKCVLVAPAGFANRSWTERSIQWISSRLYALYKNDKWYMLSQYPTYQNTQALTDTDYLIVSKDDSVHGLVKGNEQHKQLLVYKSASHFNMISVVRKQKILSQLIENQYDLSKVVQKPLSSLFNKLLFGGHFMPVHMSVWLSVASYNLYSLVTNNSEATHVVSGFLIASFVFSLFEYVAHRLFLHNWFHSHHKKHHTYPNKLSIIHVPMSIIVINGLLSYVGFTAFVHPTILSCIYLVGPLFYLAFEFTHLLSHGYTGSNQIILNAKYFHKLHHVTDSCNFGFVTPFWDYVFGTLSPQFKLTGAEVALGWIPFWSFLLHTREEF